MFTWDHGKRYFLCSNLKLPQSEKRFIGRPMKNRCPEFGAGAAAGIGPVTPASQRKDQDVMLRLLKSMETIVCPNSFGENSVCPPWCLMFVFWNLRKSAKVTSALQTVSQRCRWTCMEIKYQCNAINTDKKSKWNMSEWKDAFLMCLTCCVHLGSWKTIFSM